MRIKIFWAFIRQSFYNSAVYRFEFWLQIISIFLMMYSVYWLWSILYTQSPGSFDVSLEQMRTYGILGMALETIFAPSFGPQKYISNQIRSGLIDADLIKPIDFQFHMIARNFGELSFRACTLVFPALIVGFLFLELRFPSSLENGIFFIVSILLGYLVLFSLNFMLGMLAMIILNINSISWAYSAVIRFFAGQFIPLWLFPKFLSHLADLFPFKCIYYIPLSIYIGKLDRVEALHSIALQFIWVTVLFAISRIAWLKLQGKLVVQGG